MCQECRQQIVPLCASVLFFIPERKIEKRADNESLAHAALLSIDQALSKDDYELAAFELYPRYLEQASTQVDDGLTMRVFKDGSPYASEDMFSATNPSLIARCTRDAPGGCNNQNVRSLPRTLRSACSV